MCLAPHGSIYIGVYVRDGQSISQNRPQEARPQRSSQLECTNRATANGCGDAINKLVASCCQLERHTRRALDWQFSNYDTDTMPGHNYDQRSIV